MRRKDRYDTTGLEQDQFEPGARRRVLKNLLGITSKREMDRVEGQEQVRALEELARLYDKEHRFTAADVCRIHTIWLGRIYSWAGQYRQVNVTKDGFPFAAAAQIPKLMADFESGPLRTEKRDRLLLGLRRNWPKSTLCLLLNGCGLPLISLTLASNYSARVAQNLTEIPFLLA